jgi:energy-coupling factor transporter transmembrane protein EcfT
MKKHSGIEGVNRSPTKQNKPTLASGKFPEMIFGSACGSYCKRNEMIKSALLLAILSLSLFEYVLHWQNGVFLAFEAVLFQMQWMSVVCLVVWCGTLLLLTFNLSDLPFVGLLIIATAAYFINLADNRPATDAVTFLFGVAVGKGARFAVTSGNDHELRIAKSEMRIFLLGMVGLLAFSSWWHLGKANNFYHGPRWMGLWNNPNDYGLLMAAGLILAVGLVAACSQSTVQSPQPEGEKRKAESGNRNTTDIFATKEHKEHKENSNSLFRSFLRSLRSFAANKMFIVLFIAAGMMGVGLLFSYSRGAWLGTAVGLLYLAKAYGKFKWRWVLPPVLIALALAVFFWNTPRTAPWYFQRLDLSRGSVQHRLAAWKAGFEMMRDHPFGVGWNKAVGIYASDYSPPEGGAAAITTNDYVMLGTQLGVPGLVCFITYVALCLRSPKSKVWSPKLAAETEVLSKSEIGNRKSEIANRQDACATLDIGRWTLDARLRIACRSAAIAMLVAFWFDGGLFKLATASVFWILLELSQVRSAEQSNAECRVRSAECKSKLRTPNSELGFNSRRDQQWVGSHFSGPQNL